MAYRPSRYEQVMKASEGYDTRARRMFGGMGIYTGEKMFAILLDDIVSFKLSPEDRTAALKLDGAKPFQPQEEGHPEMPEYIVMPINILDDEDKFRFWLTKSAEYVRSKMKLVN
ncbi:MAG TPA: TfoX/Sxy family protein [Fimbriimonadales bacterium]|nr:TfoX/Sxy family protein [Fimbriimonadales bacterium]